MKEELEIVKQKTETTLAEIPIGKDVWMIFPDLHKTKPLLVTRGENIPGHILYLQQVYIDIHDRDGMEVFGVNSKGIFINKLLYNVRYASEKCYLTEKDAQEALDNYNNTLKLHDKKLRQMYEKVAKVYISENNIKLSENKLKQYLKGFIDCAMYFRDYKSLLDIQPSVPGMEKMKDFTDIKFGFE